jgi:hypothetical protein
MVQELVAAEDLIGVSQEALGQSELSLRKLDFRAIHRDLTSALIELDGADPQSAAGGAPAGVASHDGAESRRELSVGEGLGEVVVRAGIEPLHAVGHGIASGEHQDRDGGASSPDRATDLEAVHVRQTDIEDDGLDATAVERKIDGIGARARHVHDMLIMAKETAKGGSQTAVVLDEQEVHGTDATAVILRSVWIRSRTCSLAL